MKEKTKEIVSTPLLLEVVERVDGQVTYIVRSPQGKVLCLANFVDELVEYIESLKSED